MAKKTVPTAPVPAKVATPAPAPAPAPAPKPAVVAPLSPVKAARVKMCSVLVDQDRNRCNDEFEGHTSEIEGHTAKCNTNGLVLQVMEMRESEMELFKQAKKRLGEDCPEFQEFMTNIVTFNTTFAHDLGRQLIASCGCGKLR